MQFLPQFRPKKNQNKTWTRKKNAVRSLWLQCIVIEREYLAPYIEKSQETNTWGDNDFLIIFIYSCFMYFKKEKANIKLKRHICGLQKMNLSCLPSIPLLSSLDQNNLNALKTVHILSNFRDFWSWQNKINAPKPFWHLHLYQKGERRGLHAEAPNAPDY